jgi:hypothetical protein
MTWRTFFEVATGYNSPMMLTLLLGFAMSLGLALKDRSNARIERYLGIAILTVVPLALALAEKLGAKVTESQTAVIVIGTAAIFLSPFALGWIAGWPLGMLINVFRPEGERGHS